MVASFNAETSVYVHKCLLVCLVSGLLVIT